MKFEILAKLHGLSLNRNESNYLDPKTELACIFYDSRQDEINTLRHDLIDTTFAAKAYKLALDTKEIK